MLFMNLLKSLMKTLTTIFYVLIIKLVEKLFSRKLNKIKSHICFVNKKFLVKKFQDYCLKKN